MSGIKKKKAFTLIELLVVISIIALLVSILMPALSKAREKARMVVCSSNQHQLVLGLLAYYADSDGLYPPPASNGARPNLLARNKYKAAPSNDDYQYRYLGNYLPEVDVYNCPMANFDPKAVWDLGGNKYTYQELYENKGDWYSGGVGLDLSCSYVLLWNYKRYSKLPGMNSDGDIDSRIPSKPFLGPGKTTKNKLLVCDSFYFSNGLGDATTSNRWTSTHKFKSASKYASKYYPYYVLGSAGSEADLDTDNNLQTIQLNAGYTDGSVRRYQSGDTIRQQAVTGYAATYLPSMQMWK